MHNYCIFSLVRTSCENFIRNLPIEKWNFNSFDIFYERKTGKSIIKSKPKTPHVCKVYIETYENDKVKYFLNTIRDYKFIHFYRSNTMKHFLTRKLQDNLIGEYGKDYNKFRIDMNEYECFISRNNDITSMFVNDFDLDIIDYDVEIGLTDKMQTLDTILGQKLLLNDAFDLEVAEKHIINFKDIKKYL